MFFLKNKLLILFSIATLACILIYFYSEKPLSVSQSQVRHSEKQKKEPDVPQPRLENISTQKTETISQKLPKAKTENTETACAGADASNFDCWESFYKNIVEKKSTAEAFVDLKTRFPQNAYVQSQCHPLTHVIGRAAAGKFAKVSESYTQGDPFCWSGYYHGVMEGVVAKYGRKEFPNEINNICADLPGKTSYNFDYFNCVHGLGHGVMVYNNTELYDSLEMCDLLTGWWEQNSCYGGVFMENVIVDNKNHFTKYLKKDDLLYPCNAVKEKYKSQCYLMQTSYMLKLTGGAFEPVYEACAKADQGFVNTCYQSLGRDASGRSSSQVQPTVEVCNLGKTFDQQSNCLIGAVKDFISYFHSDTQATTLCAQYTGELEKVCTQTKIDYYKTLVK